MKLGGMTLGLTGMKRNMVKLRPRRLLKMTPTTKIFRIHCKQRKKQRLSPFKLRGRSLKLKVPLQC